MDNLAAKGFAARTKRSLTDRPGCSLFPVVKHPPNGGLSANQFLRYVREPDGPPLKPDFVLQFESLRTTGTDLK